MDCLNQHGIRLLADYQPLDRFWTFQLIEPALFFGSPSAWSRSACGGFSGGSDPMRVVKVHQIEAKEACHHGTFSARLRHTTMDKPVTPNGRMIASAGARV